VLPFFYCISRSGLAESSQNKFPYLLCPRPADIIALGKSFLEETMKLHVIVEKDEAGYFVAEVPALPGCLSQGKTQEEALKNIKEAIEGWLEVMEAKHPFKHTDAVEVVV
jgi:predicted RNase H-like HicB family nuclease